MLYYRRFDALVTLVVSQLFSGLGDDGVADAHLVFADQSGHDLDLGTVSYAALSYSNMAESRAL